MALNAKDLADYSNWAGRSPADVIDNVRQVGGWAKIFPKEMPKFAHKLRNYFNEIPRQLTKLGGKASKLEMERLASSFAVDDDAVYMDKAGRVWFLMRTAGTAYHVGDGKPGLATIIGSAVAPRAVMPFKLVAPDKTGGSSEVVIRNTNWDSNLGDGATTFSVNLSIDLDNDTAGSYNYSETMVTGFSAHKLRDMTPHEKFGGTYAKPHIFAPLKARTFPAKVPK